MDGRGSILDMLLAFQYDKHDEVSKEVPGHRIGRLVAGTAGIGVGSCVGRLLGFSYLFADVQAT